VVVALSLDRPSKSQGFSEAKPVRNEGWLQPKQLADANRHGRPLHALRWNGDLVRSTSARHRRGPCSAMEQEITSAARFKT